MHKLGVGWNRNKRTALAVEPTTSFQAPCNARENTTKHKMTITVKELARIVCDLERLARQQRENLTAKSSYNERETVCSLEQAALIIEGYKIQIGEA